VGAALLSVEYIRTQRKEVEKKAKDAADKRAIVEQAEAEQRVGRTVFIVGRWRMLCYPSMDVWLHGCHS